MTTGGLLDILGTFLEVPGVDVTNETIALNLEVCMRVCAFVCAFVCGGCGSKSRGKQGGGSLARIAVLRA